jgi:hypothetical protein
MGAPEVELAKLISTLLLEEAHDIGVHNVAHLVIEEAHYIDALAGHGAAQDVVIQLLLPRFGLWPSISEPYARALVEAYARALVEANARALVDLYELPQPGDACHHDRPYHHELVGEPSAVAARHQLAAARHQLSRTRELWLAAASCG